MIELKVINSSKNVKSVAGSALSLWNVNDKSKYLFKSDFKKSQKAIVCMGVQENGVCIVNRAWTKSQRVGLSGRISSQRSLCSHWSGLLYLYFLKFKDIYGMFINNWTNKGIFNSSQFHFVVWAHVQRPEEMAA